MFKMKSSQGFNNLCGRNLQQIRLSLNPPLSQRKLAYLFQLQSYDIGHHVIRRIENRERYVTDLELVMLSEVLHTPLEYLVADILKAP